MLLKCLLQKTKGFNIPIPLIDYRIVSDSLTRVSEKNKKLHKEIKISIYKKIFNNLNIDDELLNIHYNINLSNNIKYSKKEYINYFHKLLKVNQPNLRLRLGHIFLKNIQKKTKT